MHCQDILVERKNGIGRITLNRPETLNALRTQTLKEIAALLTEWSKDPSIGVIVLTGTGDKAFCVGGDISEMQNFGRSGGKAFSKLCLDLTKVLFRLPVPLIARVNGYCLGGGHELNVMCDISIASDKAIFGQTGIKVGLLPVWSSPAILPRIIGEKKSREMVFLGKKYTAHEALTMGLINTVVPHDQLDQETDRWCQQILEMSPQALRLTKKCLNWEWEQRKPLFEEGARLLSKTYLSEEFLEGTTAFLEKRKPDFMKFRK